MEVSFNYMHNKLAIDSSWTLFLDRDGTINRRLKDDYVKNIGEFEFLPNALEGIFKLSLLFDTVVIVTNQQCIDKEIMTHEELKIVHDFMMDGINAAHGRIDQIYYCPQLAVFEPVCRKPNPGMALQAKEEFPNIDFQKSIMVGDTLSDMQFGKRLNMTTVLVLDGNNTEIEADIKINNLKNLASYLI